MSTAVSASLVILAVCAVLWTLLLCLGMALFFLTVMPLLRELQRDLSKLLVTTEKELQGTLRSAQSVGDEVAALVSAGRNLGKDALLAFLFNRQRPAASRLGLLAGGVETALLVSRLLSRFNRRRGGAGQGQDARE